MSTSAEALPRRIEQVLIATDFSDGAEGAMARGLAIATQHDARIHLVHAVPADLREEDHLRIMHAASLRMDRTVREIETSGRSVTSTVRTGRPWQVITELEREVGPDLILIGKRGHTASARLLLGSTTDRVVRTATAPILTVGPEEHAAAAEFATILAPTDFSASAAQSARAAIALLPPGPKKGRLILLHAWHPVVDVYGLGTQATVLVEPFGETEAELLALLETQAKTLREDGLQVDTVVYEGYPSHVIEHVAEEHAVDLIAMGTNGRGVVQHLLLGSVAERVLHHVGCPVLTVRRAVESAPQMTGDK